MLPQYCSACAVQNRNDHVSPNIRANITIMNVSPKLEPSNATRVCLSRPEVRKAADRKPDTETNIPNSASITPTVRTNLESPVE